MSIPNNVYPVDYWGPLGVVECCRCGRELDLDEEAIQDELNNQFYCEDCHKEILAEREENE